METPGKGAIASASAHHGPSTETSRTRSIKLDGWRPHCAERVGSDGSFAQRSYCLRTGSSAAWTQSTPRGASEASCTVRLPLRWSSCGLRIPIP